MLKVAHTACDHARFLCCLYGVSGKREIIGLKRTRAHWQGKFLTKRKLWGREPTNVISCKWLDIYLAWFVIRLCGCRTSLGVVSSPSTMEKQHIRSSTTSESLGDPCQHLIHDELLLHTCRMQKLRCRLTFSLFCNDEDFHLFILSCIQVT